MKTVDIKGKAYVEVNERLIYFRANYPDWSLTTEMLSCANGVCIFCAKVLNPEGKVVATGHAYEKEGSTFINKTSYIENCETSAWGRALGNFGIGIDTAVASADEVKNAVAQQEAPQEAAEPMMTTDQKTQLSDALIDAGLEITNANKKKLSKKYGITQNTTAKEADVIIQKIIEDFAAGEML